jgi:hypothetical protein
MKPKPWKTLEVIKGYHAATAIAISQQTVYQRKCTVYECGQWNPSAILLRIHISI